MSVMSRSPGEPRKNPPVTSVPLAPVIEGETCDRCGAAPRHRVTTHSGDLLFCTHHMDLYRVALAIAGYQVS